MHRSVMKRFEIGVRRKALWSSKRLYKRDSISVTVLLEWTQKDDSDRSNKDECL